MRNTEENFVSLCSETLHRALPTILCCKPVCSGSKQRWPNELRISLMAMCEEPNTEKTNLSLSHTQRELLIVLSAVD